MNVSTLSSSELSSRLKQGISLQIGEFITHLQTSIPWIADGVELLYADYPIQEENEFADFHVSLKRPIGLRRWFKPQVQFFVDGKSPFQPLPYDQAVPMLEWGLNWCVSSHANHCLMIHAAVIEKDGYAAILPAPPGSGKSTLCAALVNRGWRLLSDEIAMVRLSDQKILPAPRPVSLKNESIDVMQRYLPHAVFSRRIFDTMKGTVAHMKAPRESVVRALEPVRPGWVIFPKYEAGVSTRLETLSQSRAFMKVADNSFNYSVLGSKGFDVLGGLINASRCHAFTYSNLDEAVETFAALEPPALGSAL